MARPPAVPASMRDTIFQCDEDPLALSRKCVCVWREREKSVMFDKRLVTEMYGQVNRLSLAKSLTFCVSSWLLTNICLRNCLLMMAPN